MPLPFLLMLFVRVGLPRCFLRKMFSDLRLLQFSTMIGAIRREGRISTAGLRQGGVGGESLGQKRCTSGSEVMMAVEAQLKQKMDGWKWGRDKVTFARHCCVRGNLLGGPAKVNKIRVQSKVSPTYSSLKAVPLFFPSRSHGNPDLLCSHFDDDRQLAEDGPCRGKASGEHEKACTGTIAR